MLSDSRHRAKSGSYDFLAEGVRLYRPADWLRQDSRKILCDDCREPRHTAEFDCFHQDTPAAFQYWIRTTCKTCRNREITEWRSSDICTPLIVRYFTKLSQSARAGAKARGIAFALDSDDVIGLYVRQRGCCALTGVSFRFEAGSGARDKRGWWRPSLDRINSNGNYAPGNVHLVAQAANLMKFDLPIELFYQLCERITERRLAGEI